MARLGHATLLAGREREAKEVATRALDTARRYKERGHEAWALSLLGEIAAAGRPPDFTVARERYAQAMALGEALEMRPMVAQCHDRLGTLYQGLGRPDLAHNHQVNAATMFREMDMQLWLVTTPSTAD